MKDKKIKHTYPYYFADGTKSVVSAKEVGQEWINILYDMDDKEKRNGRSNTRRHISIETLLERNNEPSAADEYPETEPFGDVADERLNSVLSSLTAKQKELLYDVVIKGVPQKEIAKRDGMSATAINNRYIRIIKKFQIIFEKNVDF